VLLKEKNCHIHSNFSSGLCKTIFLRAEFVLAVLVSIESAYANSYISPS